MLSLKCRKGKEKVDTTEMNLVDKAKGWTIPNKTTGQKMYGDTGSCIRRETKVVTVAVVVGGWKKCHGTQ